MNMVEILKAMENNGGLTLKKCKPITFLTGYQVATEGIETRDPEVAAKTIEKWGGNCGIWKSEGVYYIDKSRRIKTLQVALRMGKEHNQQSIFDWAHQRLIWCDML